MAREDNKRTWKMSHQWHASKDVLAEAIRLPISECIKTATASSMTDVLSKCTVDAAENCSDLRMAYHKMTSLVLTALICGVMLPPAQSLPNGFGSEQEEYGMFSLDSDRSLLDVDVDARRLCELLRTVLWRGSHPAFSPYGDSTTNALFLDSLREYCGSQRQANKRRSGSAEASRLDQGKGGYDVMWPAYVPLKSSLFQKRRWGDTISSCIQSKCSSFIGTTRVGCIVQHCQRKRSAEVY